MRANAPEQRQLLRATPLKTRHTLLQGWLILCSPRGREGYPELLPGTLWNAEGTKLVEVLCGYPQLWAPKYNGHDVRSKQKLSAVHLPTLWILSTSLRWCDSHEGSTTFLYWCYELWSLRFPVLSTSVAVWRASMCNTNLIQKAVCQLDHLAKQ